MEIHVDQFQILKDAVLQIIHVHRGREHAISRRDLLLELMRSGVRYGDEREVRQAVHALREEGNLILSTGGAGGGYSMAESWEEVDEYIEREVDARAMDLLEQKKKLLGAAAIEFGPKPVPNQLELMQVKAAPSKSPQMAAMFGGS